MPMETGCSDLTRYESFRQKRRGVGSGAAVGLFIAVAVVIGAIAYFVGSSGTSGVPSTTTTVVTTTGGRGRSIDHYGRRDGY